MFGNRIVGSAFANRYADCAMRNIKIDDNYALPMDKTFISNLRYFLCDRIPNGENIVLCELSERQPYGECKDAARRRIEYDCQDGNRVIIYQVHSEEYRNAMFEVLEEKGLREIKNVEQYYKKSFPAKCFVDDERRISIIATRRLNVHYYHMLSQSVPVILPWYFQGYKPSETDMELLKSLQEDTDEHYLKILEEKAAPFNFKEEYTRSALEGYERNFDSRKIRTVQRDIDNIKNVINDYERELANRIRELRQREIELFAYENHAETTEVNEFQRFMLANKDVELIESNEGGVTVGIRTHLMLWEETEYKTISEYEGSSLNAGFAEPRKAKRVLDHIFEEQDVKVRMYGVFHINLDSPDYSGAISRGNGANVVEEFKEESSSMNYMGNPHLEEYACMGGYRKDLRTYTAKYDLISAVDICRRSVQTLNFKDTAVMNHVGRYFQTSRRVFETPDGKLMNWEELNKWVEEKDGVTNG